MTMRNVLSSSPAAIHSKSRRRWPWLLAIGAVCFLFLVLCFVGIHEWLTARQLAGDFRLRREAGEPVDNDSMRDWFARHASTEGTKAWSDVLLLAETGSSAVQYTNRLPYLGEGKIADEIRPGQPLAEEQLVADYLRRMQPVIRKIYELQEYENPVWQPVQFQGFHTLLEDLQTSRSVVRLLQLDVEQALFQQDAERAMQGLAAMQNTAEAFAWQFCVVADLVTAAERQTHWSMVRRSLATPMWNEEQLTTLLGQIGPPQNVIRRWRNAIQGERAMGLASLDSEELTSYSNTGENAWGFYLMRWPFFKQRLCEFYQQIELAGTGNIPDLVKRNQQAEVRIANANDLTTKVCGVFWPAFVAYSSAIEREEDARRFARTAVAIKLFLLQAERWPSSLTELELVGLKHDDWNTLSRGPFGYDATDGQARVWTYSLTKAGAAVSATCPRAESEDTVDYDIVTVIR